MSDTEILFEQRGVLGLVTLNRPKALNALTADMCKAMRNQLKTWEADDSIHAVCVTGSGEKAFCAGGDVVALYKSGMAFRDGDEKSVGWREFFSEEYKMNAAIHHFKKPYIAILDGITMGGGVGISVHGSHKVATERTLFAMPETGLGLIPDVGGGYFMPRLPGATGMYLALTGERLKAAETKALGITQGYIPSERVDMLVTLLSGADSLTHEAVDKILDTLSEDPGESKLAPHMDQINNMFSKGGVEEIMTALFEDGGEWTHLAHETLLSKSPMSLAVTFEQMTRGRDMDFDDVMKMEFCIVSQLMLGNDFYEGVRSILLDRDNNPRWQPENLEKVDKKAVEAHFKAPKSGSLTL